MTRKEYAELAAKGTKEQYTTGTNRMQKYDPVETVEDYDRIMENYLTSVRSERGYTTREPDDYINSEIPRWQQDARDWVKFRDAVMLYGLEVQNHWISTGEHPTVDEFKAGLPVMKWTFAAEL
jgi:hypothetical protein